MIRLDGQSVVVVGGGNVALRKVRTLLDHGAEVIVIAPEVGPELKDAAGAGSITWIEDAFREALLDDFKEMPVLVFGTTDDRIVNTAVFRAAERRGIPCNIADVPDLCSFIVPALMRRGDLSIAISTGGASPALARRIREGLESRFGPEYETLTELLGALRSRITEQGHSSDENKIIFMRLVDAGLEDMLKSGNRDALVSTVRSIVPFDIDAEQIMDSVLNRKEQRG